MSSRERVHMSQEEVARFLDEHVKLQVSTLDRDGSPHLTTLFYAVLDGRVTFWTYGSSQKAVNLRRDPRIAVLVEDGIDYSQLRGVSLTGRAELIDDPERVMALGLRLAERLSGDLDEARRAVVEKQAPKRIAVVVNPEQERSWDHRKLA